MVHTYELAFFCTRVGASAPAKMSRDLMRYIMFALHALAAPPAAWASPAAAPEKVSLEPWQTAATTGKAAELKGTYPDPVVKFTQITEKNWKGEHGVVRKGDPFFTHAPAALSPPARLNDCARISRISRR